MQFYFTWTDQDTSFDPEIHCHDTTNIFNLTIAQKEGLFATATVTLENFYPTHTYCFITWGRELLFKGRLASAPQSLDQGLMQLKFIARNDDYQHIIAELQPTTDALFHEQMRLSDALLSRQELLYCDRRDHSLSLSNILVGQQTQNLGDNFFYDSLNMAVVGTPVQSIAVEVNAEWQQECTGKVDITENLKRRTPHGMLSTLSPNFAERWWRPGQKLPGSNYSVYFAGMTKVQPPQTGALNIYPRVSNPIQINGQAKTLPRHWYIPELILAYKYKQKRHEVAKFTLQQAVQDGFDPVHKKLTFNLQKLIETNQVWQPEMIYHRGARVAHDEYVWQCQTAHQALAQFEPAYWQRLRRGVHISDQSIRGSFFTTERGVQALDYAYKAATAHLVNSARALRVTVRGKFEDLYTITTDHSLTIADPRLPGGTVTGKVYSYTICADGPTGNRYIEVQLLLAVGTVLPREALPAVAYTEELDVLPDSAPVDGLDNPLFYHNDDFIEQIEINNDAGQQEQLLRDREFGSFTELNDFLNENATNVSLRVKNLSTKASCRREVR